MLEPGAKLLWREPGLEEEWYIPLYHEWCRRHGEEVEFVGFADEHDLHTHDVDRLPILKVKTKVGIMSFSAGYFLC